MRIDIRIRESSTIDTNQIKDLLIRQIRDSVGVNPAVVVIRANRSADSRPQNPIQNTRYSR